MFVKMRFAEVSCVAFLSSFFQFHNLFFPQIVQFLRDVVKDMEVLVLLKVFTCLLHYELSVEISEKSGYNWTCF